MKKFGDPCGNERGNKVEPLTTSNNERDWTPANLNVILKIS